MRTSPHHVLVVDDDRDLTRTLSDVLRIHGYDSVTANSGSEGLDLAINDPHPFPVALVDLQLPDMGGLELVGRLHEVADLTQVVILTGNASLDSAVAAMRERSYDYLVKPVPPDELITTVRRGVQRWHHQSAEEDLRQNRERFKLMVEALSDVVTVIDPDLRVEYQSPSALHALGYEHGERAGDPFLTLVHAADRPAVGGVLDSVRGAPGTEAELEFRIRRSDGSWCLMEGIARCLHDDAGSPVVVTTRDITERRRLEDSLRQSQKMESMGRLAGGVAHDFNNQLTAILSSVDLAEWQEDVPAPVAQELGEIRLAVRRAARLTQQLLVFSRNDVSKPRRVDVNEVARGMESMLRRLIPAHVALESRLTDDLAPVVIDPSHLEQVIMNLVVNARDAQGERAGRIIVRTYAEVLGEADTEEGVSTAGPVVVLEVEDDGEGMSEEVARRVFEPFFTTKRHDKGTGLGLATCYGIVTRADGTIRVASSPGEGTIFQIILPAAAGVAEPLERPPPADLEGTRGLGETILLVEDDDAVRRVLAKILRRQGYEVIAASGGSEALGEARTRDFDLLLSDLVMPGMTGPQVAKEVRAVKPGVRVLFTSGYADGDVLPGGQLPFSGELVSKPVEAADLLRKVRSALDASAA